MLKWISIGLVSAFVLLAGTTAKAQDTVLRWGYSSAPFPPFTSKSASGKWTGFDVDIMDAMCQEMKVKCEIVEIAWDGIIPALQANKIDLIWTGMSITDERLKVIDFTDRYRRGPAAFVAAKDLKVEINEAGLKGKSVGVQKATNFLNYLNHYYGSAASVKLYDSLDDATADLAAGRIDVVMGDILQLKIFMKTDLGKDYEIKGITPVDPLLGRGAGAGIRKGDAALKERLDAAIKAIRDSGAYDTIAKQYFDFDPYGSG
ncbi:MAG: transporter substrate-binding domain-containing protein [Alphaproteobacteria bacterium]|nr:transporter substrate-binding domain-containing protein [Alphaproteobacteria bacterium]